MTPILLELGVFYNGKPTMDKNELTFEQVLERVFHEERVPIHLLYRLSDLTPEQTVTFETKWNEAPDNKRAIISRHMADITENNFVVDFAPSFRKFLDDSSAEVRLAALDGLWDCTDMSLVAPVILLVQNDPDERVRAQAAATLGHIVLMAEWGQVDKDHARTIVDALIGEYNKPFTPPAVRRAALESIGPSADERIPKLIHAAYFEGDAAMQVSAVFAMGRNADNRWLPVVLEELENPHSEMRMEAAQAAGEIGSSDAVEPLVFLLQDEELEVRLAAIYALGKIGSDLAQEVLEDLLNDPYGDEATLEAAEIALDEMSWLGGKIDLSLFSPDTWSDQQFDEDDLISA
jgi:hypothetical protein